MIKRSENLIAIVLIFLLAIIGIAGYAFEKPQKFIRMVYKTKGGAVILDHRFHSSEEGAGLECSECHHNYDPDDQEGSEMNCRKCHFEDKDIAEEACAEAPVHKRCIGKNCVDCHGAEECGLCHKQ
jgi:hypothetical protein